MTRICGSGFSRDLFAAAFGLALSGVAAADGLVTDVKPHQWIKGVSPVAATEHTGLRSKEDLETFFDGVMAAQLKWQHFAGVTVSVVKDGKLFFAKGYGHADLEKGVEVDAEKTLFRPGSTSKLFTWTALMQQVEQGKVDLDADVNKYLTQFQIPATFPQPVTVRNLFTHTEGFEDAGVGILSKTPAEFRPLGEFLGLHIPGRVRPPTTDFNGGEVTSYSNWGASLAGLIVANVSGTGFDDYVDKHIFQPLGMTSTTFREPLPPALAARMSVGYTHEAGVFKKHDYELFHNIAPAGSAASTATDMAKFMIAHLGNGAAGDARILKEESAKLMHGRRMGLNPYISGSGLGFYEVFINGHRFICHGGDTNYFHSDMALMPEENLGIFMSYNTLPSLPIAMRDSVLQSFMDRYYPADLPVAKPPADFASRAGRYAGTWRVIRHNYTGIEKAFELLSAISFAPTDTNTMTLSSMFGDTVTQWYEAAPDVFRRVDSDEMLAFTGDQDGKAQYMLNPIGVPFIGAYRISWWEAPLFHYFVLGFGMLCFLAATVSALRNRKADNAGPPAARRARRLAAMLAPLHLVFLVGLLVAVSALLNEEAGGWPPSLKVFLALPLIAIPLTAVIAWFAAMAWRNGWWTRYQRVQYTVAAFMGIAFLWSLNLFNLVGYKFT